MGSILFFVKSGERALEGAPQSRQSGLQEIVEDLDLLGPTEPGASNMRSYSQTVEQPFMVHA
jgi:hypothetical protein